MKPKPIDNTTLAEWRRHILQAVAEGKVKAYREG